MHRQIGINRGHRGAQSGRQAEVQAQILAGSVAGALAFDDQDTTREYLNALAANPAIEAAAAYDETGRMAASYRRAGPPPPPTNVLRAPTYADRKLIVTAPVTQGATRFGSVYLRLSAETAARRLARYLAVGAIILMSTLLVAVLGFTAWRAMAVPELRGTARRIAIVLALQVAAGIATVYFAFPLAIAVLHNAGAALLVALVAMLNYQTKHRFSAAAQARPLP